MEPIGNDEVRASMEAARRQLPPLPPRVRGRSLAGEFVRFVTEGTRQRPAAWLGGAALVGFALSGLVPIRHGASNNRLPSRGRRLFGSALRHGVNALKPVVAEWGRRRISDFLQSAQKSAPAAASPAEPPVPQ